MAIKLCFSPKGDIILFGAADFLRQKAIVFLTNYYVISISDLPQDVRKLCTLCKGGSSADLRSGEGVFE